MLLALGSRIVQRVRVGWWLQLCIIIISNLSYQDSDGAREDVLKCLYLDHNNKEVLSIFSRLFPGRTVGDVTKSTIAMAAARAVEAHIRDTFGPQLPSVAKKKFSQSSSKFSGMSVLPPIRDSVFFEIRSCMEEQDFHINIIKSKKKVR